MNHGMVSFNHLAYDSIINLCFDANQLEESELISRLQATSHPEIKPEWLGTKKDDGDGGYTLLHSAVRRSPEFF